MARLTILVEEPFGGGAYGRYCELPAFPSAAAHTSTARCSTYLCGASLISPTTLLTAGSCVCRTLAQRTVGVQVDLEYYAFDVAGQTYAGVGNGSTFEAASWLCHPQFAIPVVSANLSGVVNDVALVFLSAPTSAQPVSLATSPAAPAQGDAVVAMGYGSTAPFASTESAAAVYDQQALSPVLLSVSLDVVAPFYCTCDGCIFDPATQVCAGIQQGGADTCGGDAGGALFSRLQTGGLGQVVGITSSSPLGSCGQAYQPSSYTRASSYLDFIQLNTPDLNLSSLGAAAASPTALGPAQGATACASVLVGEAGYLDCGGLPIYSVTSVSVSTFGGWCSPPAGSSACTSAVANATTSAWVSNFSACCVGSTSCYIPYPNTSAPTGCGAGATGSAARSMYVTAVCGSPSMFPPPSAASPPPPASPSPPPPRGGAAWAQYSVAALGSCLGFNTPPPLSSPPPLPPPPPLSGPAITVLLQASGYSTPAASFGAALAAQLPGVGAGAVQASVAEYHVTADAVVAGLSTLGPSPTQLGMLVALARDCGVSPPQVLLNYTGGSGGGGRRALRTAATAFYSFTVIGLYGPQPNPTDLVLSTAGKMLAAGGAGTWTQAYVTSLSANFSASNTTFSTVFDVTILPLASNAPAGSVNSTVLTLLSNGSLQRGVVVHARTLPASPISPPQPPPSPPSPPLSPSPAGIPPGFAAQFNASVTLLGVASFTNASQLAFENATAEALGLPLGAVSVVSATSVPSTPPQLVVFFLVTLPSAATASTIASTSSGLAQLGVGGGALAFRSSLVSLGVPGVVGVSQVSFTLAQILTTPTTPAPPPSSPSPSQPTACATNCPTPAPSGSTTPNIGVIVGAVVGGVAGLVILVGAVYVLWSSHLKRTQRPRSDSQAAETESTVFADTPRRTSLMHVPNEETKKHDEAGPP